MAMFNPNDARFKQGTQPRDEQKQAYQEPPPVHVVQPQVQQARQAVPPRQQQQPPVLAPIQPAAVSKPDKQFTDHGGVVASGQRDSGWSTGLFDCFSYPSAMCIVTYFLPCITYGQIVEDLTGEGCGSPCLTYCCISTWCGVPCAACVAAPTRQALRTKYDLQEEPCSDCATTVFCCVCALCQEARELEIRKQLAPPISNAYQHPNPQKMTA